MFSENEIKMLTDKTISPENINEIKCPSCGEYSIKFYYHEYLSKLPRGCSKFWCYGCKKYIHFSIESLSSIYKFNDPLKELGGCEASYEKLNKYWEKGILPQKFIKR
jgi:hypothetical protein